MRVVPGLLIPFLTMGCGPTDDGKANDDTITATYYEDVKPILDGHCINCHSDEVGISPFPLTTYESASAIADLIAVKVSAKRMPPWGAEPGHTPLKYDVSLSDEQIELQNWRVIDPSDLLTKPAVAFPVHQKGKIRICIDQYRPRSNIPDCVYRSDKSKCGY